MPPTSRDDRALYERIASVPASRPVRDEDYADLVSAMDDAGISQHLAAAVMDSEKFPAAFADALDHAMRGYSRITGTRVHAVVDMSKPAGYRVVAGAETPAHAKSAHDTWSSSRNHFATPPEFNASAFSPLMNFDAPSPV
mmetsp:Transcript_46393/g.143189  ORF Transcript_46393/g.143189 Transcript_46393/m.143189 type:complete len:140 (-) Transcript_46393:100-519(-)|eukprot:CAMPEP_0174852866 /NCGR_PEP_ID=MMETSP1114-20130205/27122_1 /TAXON_ID=312471 /ORGANISM="Neobodo designis, Strain CCAP 1951/1" /LENGTH=139 /DNA_ID=CAMNT_0016087483 /DNA_START=38 /DNA_END=457 /DNA_ORIENTATION=-